MSLGTRVHTLQLLACVLQVSERSGIPVENLEIAQGKGDMSLRRIHSDLEWNLNVEKLDDYPLNIAEHGGVVIYR